MGRSGEGVSDKGEGVGTTRAPQGIAACLGRSVKCLGLIAGVSLARLTPSLSSLFFALPPGFVSFV